MWVMAQLLGGLMIVAGVAWVYPPAGLILGGFVVMAAGVVGEER